MKYALWLLVFCTLLLAPALSEVPPLSPEMQAQQSSHILIGRVLKVEAAGTESPGDYPNLIFRVTLRVLDVVKGDGLKSQEELTFTYWQAGKRPPGWVGPGGQYQEVPADTVVRVYLTKEKTGYRLLSPNGWEKTEGKS